MLTNQDRLLYFDELRTRIDSAQRAWAEASASLRDGRPSEDFWYHVEAFLSASIGAANLLWPTTKKRTVQDRAAQLRTAIKAGPSAPAGLRDVRNGFEHFDERIDTWRATSADHTFIDTNIAPAGSISADPGDIARNYDPVANELAVFGKSTSVTVVLGELAAIRAVTPERY